MQVSTKSFIERQDQKMFDSMRRAKLYAAEDDNEAKQLNEATKTRLETIMTE